MSASRPVRFARPSAEKRRERGGEKKCSFPSPHPPSPPPFAPAAPIRTNKTKERGKRKELFPKEKWRRRRRRRRNLPSGRKVRKGGKKSPLMNWIRRKKGGGGGGGGGKGGKGAFAASTSLGFGTKPERERERGENGLPSFLLFPLSSFYADSTLFERKGEEKRLFNSVWALRGGGGRGGRGRGGGGASFVAGPWRKGRKRRKGEKIQFHKSRQRGGRREEKRGKRKRKDQPFPPSPTPTSCTTTKKRTEEAEEERRRRGEEKEFLPTAVSVCRKGNKNRHCSKDLRRGFHL